MGVNVTKVDFSKFMRQYTETISLQNQNGKGKKWCKTEVMIEELIVYAQVTEENYLDV